GRARRLLCRIGAEAAGAKLADPGPCRARRCRARCGGDLVDLPRVTTLAWSAGGSAPHACSGARITRETPGYGALRPVGAEGPRAQAVGEVLAQRLVHGLDPAHGMADAPGDRGARPLGETAETAVATAEPQRLGKRFDQPVHLGARPFGAAGVVHVLRLRQLLLQIGDARLQGLSRLVVEDVVAAIGVALALCEIEAMDILAGPLEKKVNVAQPLQIGQDCPSVRV